VIDTPPASSCAKFSVGSSSWLLLTIYRRPDSPGGVFLDELSTALESLVVHGCPLVIGGDINVHVEDPTNALAAGYVELLASMDLHQHIAGTTHVAGGTLDHVITHSDFSVDQLHVDPPGIISDHSLITGSLPVDRCRPPPSTRLVRSWRQVDRIVLRQAIVDSPLGQPLSPDVTSDELFTVVVAGVSSNSNWSPVRARALYGGGSTTTDHDGADQVVRP